MNFKGSCVKLHCLDYGRERSQPKLLNNFLSPAATGAGRQRKHCMYGRAIPAPSACPMSCARTDGVPSKGTGSSKEVNKAANSFTYFKPFPGYLLLTRKQKLSFHFEELFYRLLTRNFFVAGVISVENLGLQRTADNGKQPYGSPTPNHPPAPALNTTQQQGEHPDQHGSGEQARGCCCASDKQHLHSLTLHPNAADRKMTVSTFFNFHQVSSVAAFSYH